MSAVRPDWARLFRIACSLIRQVNSERLIIDSWSFGDGTAMMLQIDHRESHDVGIFLSDAQLLPFLDPKLHDFKFDIWPSNRFVLLSRREQMAVVAIATKIDTAFVGQR